MRVYRASDLGGCLKAQIANQLGYTALQEPARHRQYYADGTAAEEVVIQRLSDDGYLVANRQMEVNLEVSATVCVQGHIDGTYRDSVVEVKSMTDRSFKEFNEKRWNTPGLVQKYKWQTSTYMLATESPLLFVVYNRDTGEYLTVWKHDPFYTKTEILERILTMESFVRQGILPDECDIRQYPCPVYYLHVDEPIEDDEEIDELAKSYKEADREIKVADGKKRIIREKLIAAMGDRKKVATEKTKATFYTQKVTRLDVDAMKVDGVDVEKYETKDERRIFRVTVRTDDESESRRDGDRENAD